jgi:hypothetical protein
MRRYAISGLALTVLVLGGCSSAPTRVGLDPDVEYVAPVASVVYASPTTTAPATTTVIAPATTTVVQTPAETTTIPAPATTVLPAPGATVVPAPGTVVVPAPGTTTVVPAPGTVVSTPPPAAVPQTLRAEGIETQRVRANTIYANKIEANEILGVIHQDRNLKVGNTKGDIKGGPEVVASVIYADEIKATSVVADHIYVRNIRRR